MCPGIGSYGGLAGKKALYGAFPSLCGPVLDCLGEYSAPCIHLSWQSPLLHSSIRRCCDLELAIPPPMSARSFVLPAKGAAAVLTAAGGLIGVFARMGSRRTGRDASDRPAAATEDALEATTIAWRVAQMVKEARAADNR